MHEETRARGQAERDGLPFLLYRGGGGEQRMVELNGERLTIGRRASNEVALPWDGQVSRVHAELVRMGADWVVCDEGISHNGTFVNGERVRGRRRLRPGDVLAVGATTLTIHGHETSSAGATRAARPAGGAGGGVSGTPAPRPPLQGLFRPPPRA